MRAESLNIERSRVGFWLEVSLPFARFLTGFAHEHRRTAPLLGFYE
jgi:hypothetical protein